MLALTDTWSHALMNDDVEPARGEHTGRSNRITGRHTGRGLVRECARTHAHHDQSMPCHDGAWRRHGHESTRIGDVGGRGRRLGANLENPSTTVHAQSSTLDGHGGRWRRVGDARAGSGLQKSGSHQPPPPFFRISGCARATSTNLNILGG